MIPLLFYLQIMDITAGEIVFSDINHKNQHSTVNK